MIGFSILENLFTKIIATGLVQEVFHSVIVRDDGKGNKKPSAPVGKKFIYVGIDDSEGFRCYCRAVGPMEVIKNERVSESRTAMTTRTLHRLVFYSPNEGRGHDDLSSVFLNTVLGVPGIKFGKLLTIAEDFIRQEQPTGSFSLAVTDYYAAIDFGIEFVTTINICEGDSGIGGQIGCGEQNPFCLAE